LKRIRVKEGALPRMAALDKEWGKHYPSLLAFLADGEYDAEDGGGKRELGMMSLWAMGGFWHGKLRDNDSGHCCYVSGTTLGELLKAADAACSDPAGGWKPDPGASKGRKK